MSFPLKLGKPEAVRKQINDYFALCEKTKKPFTVMGICNVLGISRQTWHNYQDKWAEYADVMGPARRRVEQWWEERLAGTACTGAIFWLKNNGGYKDTTQQEISGPDGSPVQYAKVEIVGVVPPNVGDTEVMDADAL